MKRLTLHIKALLALLIKHDEKYAKYRADWRDLTGAVRYTLDERRVAKYLCDVHGVGGGTDPVGFLIASHAMGREMLDVAAGRERR